MTQRQVDRDERASHEPHVAAAAREAFGRAEVARALGEPAGAPVAGAGRQ